MALSGVLPPLVVALLLLGPAWRPLGAKDRTLGPVARAAGPAAVGLGALAGHLSLVGAPPLAWDLEFKHGLFPLALLTLLLGVFEAVRDRVAPLLRAGLCLFVPFYQLDFVRAHRWSATESVLWTLCWALLLGLVLWIAERVAARCKGPAVPLSWTLLGTGCSLAVLFSGSASLAQLLGTWTTVTGVMTAFAWLRPARTLAGGALPAVGVLYACGVLGGLYASELAPTSAALLTGAALAPGLALLPRLGPRARGILVVAGPLLLAAAAALLEFLARPEDPYAGYY